MILGKALAAGAVLLELCTVSKAASQRPDSPSLLCARAISVAERTAQIPPQLLHTIALVETGRRDALTGAISPWPWTIDVNGTGFFFDRKEQAIAAVEAFQAQGVQSIDVGCMQINLVYHANAFASLEDAFDPRANVGYAARFLNRLFLQTSTWPQAAAAYHSQTPEISAEYLRRIMALWPLGQQYVVQAPPDLPRQYTSEFAARVTADRADLSQVYRRMRLPALMDMRQQRTDRLQKTAVANVNAIKRTADSGLPAANDAAIAAFRPIAGFRVTRPHLSPTPNNRPAPRVRKSL